MNRNSNVETRITLTDGTTWVETYRNSFGSYCNMLDRVADKIDGTKSPSIREATDEGGTFETKGGATFTTGPVLTDADRVVA